MRSSLLVLSCAALAACSSSPLEPEWDDLEEARFRWQEAGIADYSFELRRICECLGTGPVLIVVEDGVIVSTEWVGTPPAEPLVPFSATVDELLDLIGETLADEPARATASYAPAGYPIDVMFDLDETTADDEWGISIRAFTPL